MLSKFFFRSSWCLLSGLLKIYRLAFFQDFQTITRFILFEAEKVIELKPVDTIALVTMKNRRK